MPAGVKREEQRRERDEDPCASRDRQSGGREGRGVLGMKEKEDEAEEKQEVV